MREVEAAEQIAREAIAALETARDRLSTVTRQECRREQAEAKARVHLRVVRTSP